MSDADDYAARADEIARRVRAGESYRSIGRALGISHARVGAIIADHDPEAPAEGERVRAQRRPQRDEPPMLRKRDPICGRYFRTRSLRRRTCGDPACAAEWRRRRLHLDPELRERHQRQVAQHIVSNPGRYPAANERWARRKLGLDEASTEAA